MDLRNTAVLSSLNMGLLSARKYDKKETASIAQRTGAKVEAIRLNKRLFSESTSYKAIAAIHSQARAYFNANSNPWEDGKRIYKSSFFMEMSMEMNKFKTEFYRAVPTFKAEYAALRLRDKAILNGLWNEADYPPVERIDKKFHFEVEVEPLPDTTDWRLDVGAEEMEILRRQAVKSVEDKINRSMREPYQRLFDGIAHMASRVTGATTCPCSDCKGKVFKGDSFSDSVVDNLVKLVDVLPKLNLTDDPKLAGLIEETKQGLTVFHPQAIRNSSILVETLAERAAKLQEELGWVLKAA